jgi:hypothetical protein
MKSKRQLIARVHQLTKELADAREQIQFLYRSA